MLYKFFILHNTINMKTQRIFKNIFIIVPIFIIMFYSLLNMKNAAIIKDIYKPFFNRQILWFIIGFSLIIILQFIKPKIILKYSLFYYIFGNILLLLLMFFGDEVNGAKAWFNLGIFNFQPSELMKLFLILYLAKIIGEYKIKNKKDEFKLILKVLFITIIPSFLTFLEPDTGAVIIYFVIAFMMLFLSKIKKQWFLYLFIILLILGGIFFYLYFREKDIFIKIFGTKFFYRMDRLIDFKKQSSLQLENALISIGSSGLFGSGINKVTLYFPEAPTDFIFAMSLSNFGIIGGLTLILSYAIVDLNILVAIKKIKNFSFGLAISGFIGMFIFQQFQNIFMNIGLLPIIGITLPFLSYGGSSTIIYFFCLGLVLKIINDNYKLSM